MALGPVRKARRLLPLFVLAALACRLLIPAGYMPAALDEGGPIQLCSSGLPSSVLPGGSGQGDHHDHDGSHDPDGSHELAWEHCPFGVLLSVDAIDIEYGLAIPYGFAQSAWTAYRRISAIGARTPFNARAPPRTSLI